MKNLREARNDAGLTQKKISEAIGISQQSYSDYENGRTFPDEMTLIKLANTLNISVDYLLGRTDDIGAAIPIEQNLSRDEREVLDLYSSLSPTRKEDLRIYLRALSGTAQEGKIKTKKIQ